MLIELRSRITSRKPVEVREQLDLKASVGCCLFNAVLTAQPLQVFHQRFGMHHFLDVQRRGRHHEIGPIGHVLAAPHQLRVEVSIEAVVGHSDRSYRIV